MNTIQKSIPFVRLAVALVFILPAVASPAQGTEPESDFKWFSTLGFPDVKACPYVRIATGRWSQSGEDPPQNQYVNGFLLTTNGPTFRVLTLDLSEATFTNAVHGTNEYEHVGFERLDLKTEADADIKSLRNTPARRGDWLRFGEPLTTRTETFVLGWACWQQGLDTQAEQLYEQAEKLPPGRPENEATNSFRESIEKDLAYEKMWQAVVCFGDPSISRPQLLVMFNAIVINYPHSEYHERAVQTAEMLRKMIAEDETHARMAPTSLDQLPVPERVQELIFRLRDQNGHQWSQPGSCDIFDDWRGLNTNTPAHQLVRLGYAAVPQLIAALDDPALSRSVGYWRDFTFSHSVLTVGDCAEAILQRITGRSFFVPTYTSSYLSKDQKASATRKAAEAWWAEFQTKGEKQMLVDAISSPGNDSPAEAEMLCQRYPDVAVATLIRGIQATTNEWIRSSLVRRIGQINRPEVIAFLNQEMTNSPVLPSRVAAAYELRRTNKQRAVAAMIGEWERFDPATPEVDDGASGIVEFLASSDSPEAIAALAHGIQQRPVQTRLTIVEDTDPFWLSAFTTNSRATRTAIEEFLVQELGDTEERVGMSGSRNGKDFNDPRVCDFAGAVLAERYTNRYAFDLSASLKVRDRQRIQCINVWRQAHGLAPEPLPPEPSIHVKPEQATTVTSIEWRAGGVKPRTEFKQSIAAFNGTTLEASNVVALLTRYASAPEPQSAGLQFTALKDEDLTGVRLLIRLIPGHQLTSSQDYSVNERVTLGRKGLLGSGGAGGSDYYRATGGWSDLADAIKEAVAGNPETPFEIGVQIMSSGSN